jgi:hypothetical protein
MPITHRDVIRKQCGEFSVAELLSYIGYLSNCITLEHATKTAGMEEKELFLERMRKARALSLALAQCERIDRLILLGKGSSSEIHAISESLNEWCEKNK